jgi:hypothetical protein
LQGCLVQISHGGSQGFKSPHLHPQHCRSERREPRAGGAHCILRPRCGRKLKLQGSWKALRDHGTRPQASHHDHVAWSLLAAYRRATLARIQPLPVGTRSNWPQPNHRPRRPGQSRPPLAEPCSCLAHRHAPHLLPVGHSGSRKARTPDAHTGHWTLRRSHRTPDTDRLDRQPWTPTLAPDTDADRATTAQPASGPPGPPRRATACWTPNRVPALALPGSCWVALRARPRPGALLSSDEFGPSVERAA